MNDQSDASPQPEPPESQTRSSQPEDGSRSRFGEGWPTPWLTYGIVAVCLSIFGYLNLATGTPSFERVTEFLAPRSVTIWPGAYWGLITPAFVHLAFWHLFFNLWVAKDLGQVMEPVMGRLRFLALVLGSAAASHGTELAISGQTGIGFSGVIYALFGYAMAMRRVEPMFEIITNRRTIQWLLGWAVLCMALTAFKIWNVANAAHFGGLVFGYCVGAARIAPRFRAAYGAALIAVSGLAVLSAFYAPWSPAWKNREDVRNFLRLIGRAHSGDAVAQFQYGEFLLRFGDRKQEGLDLMKMSARKDFLPAMNGLAWVFATSTNASLRNGTEAVKWAAAACAKDDWKDANLVDTLAAAHAEMNQWDEAVKAQERAISLLTVEQKSDAKLASGFESRLRQYRNQEKFRE